MLKSKHFRLKYVGTWSLERPIDEIRKLNKVLVLSPLERALDLGGRTLIGAVVKNWPFYGVKELTNGTITDDSGIDVSLMRVLSEKMNFR